MAENAAEAGKPVVWNDQKIARVRSITFANIYANNTYLGFSNWDMWISFGEIMGQQGENLVVEEKARIVMSLQQAKAFIEVLNKNLELFEKQFGEIKVLGQDLSQEK